MTAPTLACPLDIPDKTLSALRDGLLGAGERQRLESRLPTCAACQQRLAQFERLGWT
ncbi:MAG TPA: hypothetical protein VGP82_17950 [Ktedonobacterales bacterium]|nr:hypothetical protein [Ktedonobacterales bacterium]